MLTKIDNSVIINDDNLTTSGILPNNIFDVILFDPPFFTLYKDGNYSDFIYKRIDSSLKSLNEFGSFVSINYPVESDIIEKRLLENGLYKNWEMNIPTINRNNRSYRTSKISIRCFSNENNNSGEIKISEIHHRSGSNKVNEAMPTWEVEAIFYLLNIDSDDIILDMFGGGGTIPYVSSALKANCLSIEKDTQRYNGIINRLNSICSSYKCNVISCRNEANVNIDKYHVCRTHYQAIRNYKNRNAFIGMYKDLTPIETGSKIASNLSIASSLLNKAQRLSIKDKKENLTETINYLRYSYGQRNTTLRSYTKFL